MVQIISRGGGKQTTCKHCGSVLRYLPNEVKVGYSTDYTGSTDRHKYIECPVCDEQVYVN